MAEAIFVHDSFEPTPKRCHVAHAWLTAAQYERLAREAERRRMHPDALLSALIGDVLDHGSAVSTMASAVLDPES